MKILSFMFETSLQFSEPVTDHDFVLRCLPAGTPRQTVLDCQAIISPRASVSHQIDGFGNRLQIGRIESAHDEFSFISSGMVVTVSDGADALHEAAHPMYANPSAYASANAQMRAFAEDAAGGMSDPWDTACALSSAIFSRFRYEKGVTDVTTTAAQAFELGRGVCQDYAHVLIAMLRARGLHARYVNGLIVGEGATHAWVEVHDGERWRGIDPTHDRPVGDSYIELSHGRDFLDCPIESGVFRGGARQSQRVDVQVFDQGTQQ